MSNKGTVDCHGYGFEEFTDAFELYPFTDRANSLVQSMGGLQMISLLVTTYYYQKPKFEVN